jgi:hypothetical protein
MRSSFATRYRPAKEPHCKQRAVRHRVFLIT